MDFAILWFENQLRDLVGQIGELEHHISEAGFIPKIVYQPDSKELAKLSARQENFHEFDLVVVDWDLDGDDKGDEVARQVRRRFGFTDIIFYSGKKPDDLRDMVKQKAIDGVYCIHRRDLIEKMIQRVDYVVAGMSRLAAMRGLSMGVVGQCDMELKSLVAEAYELVDRSVREKAISELDELVSSGQKKQMLAYEACGDLSARLDSRAISSFHLWKLAMMLIKGNPRFTKERKLLAEYDMEVLKPRNALGHAIEIEREGQWEIQIRDAGPMTSADFPKLRKAFASHISNIKAIRALLKGD
ncbi:hypothetical protein [Neorhizobium petrolearium]|uniref:hypothetical protein n=1 Tax=Neorhizobium petrolearium TaxID=515361 RepID=UPI003F7D881B